MREELYQNKSNTIYRAKNKEIGKWVEGFYSTSPKSKETYIITLADPKEVYIFSFEKVRPETVGQFTGLHDNTKWKDLPEDEKRKWLENHKASEWKGRRIFEGDIILGLMLHTMSVKAVCTFKDGSFGLKWVRGSSIEFTPFTSICNTEFEVIGNIHDNPELLEGD